MVSLPGPPAVMAKMLPMAWNVPMNAPTKLMIKSGRSCGMVTCRNFCHMPAPSTSAASYISFGMLFMAAR